jgi:hypothetical protein
MPVNELLSGLHSSAIIGVIARKLLDLLIAMVVSTEDVSAIVSHRFTPEDPPPKTKSQPQSKETMQAMMWQQRGRMEDCSISDRIER